MTEAAIALPLLLFLAFGMTEFGQYFYIRSAFEAATRDAARFAIPATAQQGDPAAAATRALAACNITFNSSWLIIIDLSAGGTLITDVSSVPAGHLLIFSMTATYYQIPGACRPLYAFTGFGITNTKTVTAQTAVIKE
jgi:hypothetical protein